MNAESPASNASRAESSSEVSRPAGAAGERASFPIFASAASVGSCSSETSSGPERISPPAEAIIVATHTEKPS